MLLFVDLNHMILVFIAGDFHTPCAVAVLELFGFRKAECPEQVFDHGVFGGLVVIAADGGDQIPAVTAPMPPASCHWCGECPPVLPVCLHLRSLAFPPLPRNRRGCRPAECPVPPPPRTLSVQSSGKGGCFGRGEKSAMLPFRPVPEETRKQSAAHLRYGQAASLPHRPFLPMPCRKRGTLHCGSPPWNPAY